MESKKGELESNSLDARQYTPQPPSGGFPQRGPAVWNAVRRTLYRKLKMRARKMRINQTPAEAMLWTRIKKKQLGVRFRRQHQIAKYIVDFYCVEKFLAIEIDGEIHNLQHERDQYREDGLRKLGCHVIRFTNEQVINQLNHVLDTLREIIQFL